MYTRHTVIVSLFESAVVPEDHPVFNNPLQEVLKLATGRFRQVLDEIYWEFFWHDLCFNNRPKNRDKSNKNRKYFKILK